MSWNDYDVPAAGVCCLVVFTVSIILFACSFDVLEPRYYGLMYDDTFKTVGRSDILRENRDDNGRLLIGLGRSILYYPVSLVVMEFLPGGADGGSMNVWTSNGQSVFLDVLYRWLLLPVAGAAVSLPYPLPSSCHQHHVDRLASTKFSIQIHHTDT